MLEHIDLEECVVCGKHLGQHAPKEAQTCLESITPWLQGYVANMRLADAMGLIDAELEGPDG